LRTSRLSTLNFRTELNAGFAADGYARVSGRVAPLLLSTGPGALNALPAIMEAASAHVPVVAIASQIPSDMIGKRRGYLHELHDQQASFSPIVKWAGRAERAGQLPDLIAQAWREALSPPSGPTYVEVPVDVLLAAAAMPRDAPMSVGFAPDDRAFQELLARADVVLCVGTELGAETTAQYALQFRGRLIQIDADARRIGATYPALGLVGDAAVTLRALLERVSAREEGNTGTGARRAREVRERIDRGLDAQPRNLERGLLATIRSVLLPRDAVHAWDMTIL